MVYWELKKLEILCCWKKNLEWCNLELTENCFFIFKALGDQILFVNRPDKKKILFFNDKSSQFSVDEGGFFTTEPLGEPKLQDRPVQIKLKCRDKWEEIQQSLH